jgi:hypothetical protein
MSKWDDLSGYYEERCRLAVAIGLVIHAVMIAIVFQFQMFRIDLSRGSSQRISTVLS